MVEVALPTGGTSNTYIFSGTAIAVTATVAGTIATVDNTQDTSLEGVSPTLIFKDAGGNILLGAPMDAGTYTVTATFAGSPDYAAATSAVTSFIITKATPLVTVVAATVSYDGKAHGATATVAGVGGSVLQASGITYTHAGSTLTSPPVNAGTYTVSATFAADTDYISATGSATLTIVAAGGGVATAPVPGDGGIATLHQLPGVPSPDVSESQTLGSFGPSNSAMGDLLDGTSAPITGGIPQAQGLLATGSPSQGGVPGAGTGTPGQGPAVPSATPLADLVNDPSKAAGLASYSGPEPTLQGQGGNGDLADVTVSVSPGGTPDISGYAGGQPIAQNVIAPVDPVADLPGLNGGGQHTYFTPSAAGGGSTQSAQPGQSEGNGSGAQAPPGFVYSIHGLLSELAYGMDLNETDSEPDNGTGTFTVEDSMDFSDSESYPYADGNGETITITYNYSVHYDKLTTGTKNQDTVTYSYTTWAISILKSETYTIDSTTNSTSGGETDNYTVKETLTTSFDTYVNAHDTYYLISYSPTLGSDYTDFSYVTSGHDTDAVTISGSSSADGGNTTESYLNTYHSVDDHSSTETDYDNNGTVTGTLALSDSLTVGGSWDDAGSSSQTSPGNGAPSTEQFHKHADYAETVTGSLNGDRNSVVFVGTDNGFDDESHSDSGSDTTSDTEGPDSVLYNISEPAYSHSDSAGVTISNTATVTLFADGSEEFDGMQSTENYGSTVDYHDKGSVAYGADAVTGAPGGTTTWADDSDWSETLGEIDSGDGNQFSTDVTGSVTDSSEQQGTSGFQDGSLGAGAVAQGGMGAQLLAGLTSGTSLTSTDSGTQNFDAKMSGIENYFGHEDWQSGSLSPTDYSMDITTVNTTNDTTGGNATVVSSDADDIEQDTEKFKTTTAGSDTVHDVYSGVGAGATLTTDETTSESAGEDQEGSDTADSSDTGTFTLLGSDVPHPTQPAASSTLVDPSTGDETGATGTFSDVDSSTEGSTDHNEFVQGGYGWNNTAVTVAVTDTDKFTDAETGTDSSTDSGPGESDQIAEKNGESDKGSDQFNYSLTMTPASGSLPATASLTESGVETDDYQETDGGNDGFGLTASSPLDAPATPSPGDPTAGNMQAQVSGTDQFQIKMSDHETFALGNMTEQLTGGVWALGNVSATLTDGGSDDESDSGSAGIGVAGDGASADVTENYKDSDSVKGSVTFTASGGGDQVSVTESGNSSDSFSESDGGQDGINLTLPGSQASLNGNDTFKITVSGFESITLDPSGTVTIDESSGATSSDSETAGDNINVGTGADAVQDTDSFSAQDASSSSDSMHVAVSAGGAITNFSETMSEKDSSSATASGSDSTGGAAPDSYNDTESETGGASITIGSTDGVNFTESDTETDPYIFKDQENPGGGAADQQTGYVSVDMTRNLTWGADGTVNLVNATVGGDGSYQDAVKGNGTFQISGAGAPGSFTNSVSQTGISALGNLTVSVNASDGWLGSFFDQINTGIETGTQNATATGSAPAITNTVTATAGGGTQVVQTTATTTETIIYNAAGLVLSDVLVSITSGQTLESRAYTYDPAGNKLTATDGGQTTAWTYDANGRKLTETAGYGTAQAATTHYSYDCAGNLASVTDPDSNVTTFTYNTLGEVTSMTDPLGHTTYETYNDAGELSSVTNRDGLTRKMTYTPDGQLATETWYAADGTTVVDTLTYTYYDASDDNGNHAEDGKLMTAGNSVGTYTFQYDAQGRVTHVTEPFGVWLTFGYDVNGNRTLVTDSFGGATNSVYDADNELTNLSFSQNGQPVLSVAESYTAQNQQLKSQSFYTPGTPAQLVATSNYTYDAAGRLTDLDQTGNGNTIADYQENYDSGNQLTSQTISGAVQNYTYDGQGQVTSADGKTYAYDGNGNRTISGYVIGPDNQVLSDGVYNYTYDAEGNEATKTKIAGGDKWTYTYDNLDHLTKAVDKTGTGALEMTAVYKYDVFGNRIEKDVTQGTGTAVVTKFAQDGWNPALAGNIGNIAFNVWADLNADGSLATRYIHGDAVDQLIARVSPSGTPAWYLVDNQGSIRNIVNNSGTVLDSIMYDAYGNITAETNASNRGRYAWTGRELDVETGLQYNRARSYDSGTGRWISQDPMGFDAGDSNLYRYVGNKLTEATDPSGLDQLAFSVYARGKYSVPYNKNKLTAKIRVELDYTQTGDWIDATAKYSITNANFYRTTPNASNFKLYSYYNTIPDAPESDVPIGVIGSPGKLSGAQFEAVVNLGRIDACIDKSYWGRINVYPKSLQDGRGAVQYVSWTFVVKNKMPQQKGSWISLSETGSGREGELGPGKITVGQILALIETSGITGQLPYIPGPFTPPTVVPNPFPDRDLPFQD